MTRRIGLELRRVRGQLAHAFIMLWPGDPFIFRSIPLGWAGLYAHWDWDRRNWQEPSA